MTVPNVTATFTLLMKALSVLPPCASTVVEEGAPLKTTLLAPVDVITDVVSNVMVTITAVATVPNTKLLDAVVIAEDAVVITLVPLSGPTMDTAKPPDVIVDPITVRNVDVAPAR